jgi:hypothetical protein
MLLNIADYVKMLKYVMDVYQTIGFIKTNVIINASKALSNLEENVKIAKLTVTFAQIQKHVTNVLVIINIKVQNVNPNVMSPSSQIITMFVDHAVITVTTAKMQINVLNVKVLSTMKIINV